MNEGYKLGAVIFGISMIVVLFGGLGIAYLRAYIKAKKTEEKTNKTKE